MITSTPSLNRIPCPSPNLILRFYLTTNISMSDLDRVPDKAGLNLFPIELRFIQLTI